MNLTNHLDHKPGARTEVDRSGPTMFYTDPKTGEIVKVYLFVAVLSYSMFAYVEPTLDMKMKTWIMCNAHMFEFFGGVTNQIKCDNLKTGVVSHPKEGEVILTDDYLALGEYYLTAIMPAGVRKPKQKAGAEGTVGQTAKQIIAKLRNCNFTSLNELKAAVRERLDIFNSAPFQKRDGSRKSVYLEEKQYLRPLPPAPFVFSEWSRGHKVGIDFHVIYKNNRYSVPYQYAHKSVDLKITDQTIEIYYKTERIAIHDKFPDYVKYRASTKVEHMPPEFVKTEWDKDRILKWAASIGQGTLQVTERIFEEYKVKEQGYNPTMSVLRLSKTYSQERLENACELALTKYRVPRYHHIKALLKANQDKICSEKQSAAEHTKPLGYLRSSDHYGGSSHD